MALPIQTIWGTPGAKNPEIYNTFNAALTTSARLFTLSYAFPVKALAVLASADEIAFILFFFN